MTFRCGENKKLSLCCFTARRRNITAGKHIYSRVKGTNNTNKMLKVSKTKITYNCIEIYYVFKMYA